MLLPASRRSSWRQLLDWTQGMVSKAEKGDRTLDAVELREWLRNLGQDLPAFTELWEQRIAAHEASVQARPIKKFRWEATLDLLVNP